MDNDQNINIMTYDIVADCFNAIVMYKHKISLAIDSDRHRYTGAANMACYGLYVIAHASISYPSFHATALSHHTGERPDNNIIII